jgi:hypothetical protein
MTTRVVHCKKEPFDVYIGRSQNIIRGRWGNPFTHLPQFTSLARHHVPLDKVLVEYEKWLRTQTALMHDIVPLLRGKILGCWCKPGPCHGDVLAKLADGCQCEQHGNYCETHANCRCGCPRHAHAGYTRSCMAGHVTCDCEVYQPRSEHACLSG